MIFKAPAHRLMSNANPPAPKGWGWLFDEATEDGFWPLACPECLAKPPATRWDRLDRPGDF
jgi:hypothetical protein